MNLVLKTPASARERYSWMLRQLLLQARVAQDFNWQESGNSFLESESRQLLTSELMQSIFDQLSLQVEVTCALDAHGRVDENQLTMETRTPWITELAKELFAEPFQNQEFHVFLSHDVDRTTGSELTSIVKGAQRSFVGRKTHWLGFWQTLDRNLMLRRLHELLELEQREGIKGIYFMIAGPAGFGRYANRTDIRWRSGRRALKLIQEHGGVVGLHGSYHARENNSYAEEARRISNVSGSTLRIHRNHYLRLDPKRFCSQLEAAGLEVDFSLGFVDKQGFRAGVCDAWQAWDLEHHCPAKVVAVPLVYMEKPGQQLNPEPMLKELEQTLNRVAGCGGAVSLLIHPEVFAVDRRWYGVYKEIISICKNLGARLDTDPLGYSKQRIGGV